MWTAIVGIRSPLVQAGKPLQNARHSAADRPKRLNATGYTSRTIERLARKLYQSGNQRTDDVRSAEEMCGGLYFDDFGFSFRLRACDGSEEREE
jgi:hypothetical protein